MKKRESGRRVGYLWALLAGLAVVLFLNVNRVQAAESLALFSFENAKDLKVGKGEKIDLSGDVKATGWKSSNPKVVKVSKKGVVSALKTGKAVVSAKINGKKKECQVTVAKDAVKASGYLKKAYRTWECPESGKKAEIKSGKFLDGLKNILLNIEKQNDDDVEYKSCKKITAVEEDESGATVYFEATGVLNGKERSFPCTAVFTDDYEYEKYDYALMMQPVLWITDEGKLLYGAGSFWYA